MDDNVFRGERYHVCPVRLMCSVFITKIMHKRSILIFYIKLLVPGTVPPLDLTLLYLDTEQRALSSTAWMLVIEETIFSMPAIETLSPVIHLQPSQNTDRDTQLPLPPTLSSKQQRQHRQTTSELDLIPSYVPTIVSASGHWSLRPARQNNTIYEAGIWRAIERCGVFRHVPRLCASPFPYICAYI